MKEIKFQNAVSRNKSIVIWAKSIGKKGTKLTLKYTERLTAAIFFASNCFIYFNGGQEGILRNDTGGAVSI